MKFNFQFNPRGIKITKKYIRLPEIWFHNFKVYSGATFSKLSKLVNLTWAKTKKWSRLFPLNIRLELLFYFIANVYWILGRRPVNYCSCKLDNFNRNWQSSWCRHIVPKRSFLPVLEAGTTRLSTLGGTETHLRHLTR